MGSLIIFKDGQRGGGCGCFVRNGGWDVGVDAVENCHAVFTSEKCRPAADFLITTKHIKSKILR